VPSTDGLTPENYRSLAAFRHALRRFLRFSEQAARSAGIEPQQHQLLLAIKGMPGDLEPTVREVADRLQLQHHTVVELADRLADHGYLTRNRQESDRRRVLLALTEKGEELLAALSQEHLDELLVAGPELVRSLTAILQSATKDGTLKSPLSG
jgi:DNA-binding MarR family transcriptional regulator